MPTFNPDEWRTIADAIGAVFMSVTGGCVALIGAVLAFLKWGVPAWDQWRTKRRGEIRQDIRDHETDLAAMQTEIVIAILRTLEYLVQETGAQRAVVVHVHNCGGPLDVMRFTRSTIVYEEVADGVVRMAKAWQDQPIDRHYVENVSKILDVTDGPSWVHVVREELPSGSIQRNLFERFGVPSVLKHFIASREKGHWFIALHLRTNDPAPPTVIDHARDAAGSLRDKLIRFEAERAKLEDKRRELEKV